MDSPLDIKARRERAETRYVEALERQREASARSFAGEGCCGRLICAWCKRILEDEGGVILKRVTISFHHRAGYVKSREVPVVGECACGRVTDASDNPYLLGLFSLNEMWQSGVLIELTYAFQLYATYLETGSYLSVAQSVETVHRSQRCVMPPA